MKRFWIVLKLWMVLSNQFPLTYYYTYHFFFASNLWGDFFILGPSFCLNIQRRACSLTCRSVIVCGGLVYCVSLAFLLCIVCYLSLVCLFVSLSNPTQCLLSLVRQIAGLAFGRTRTGPRAAARTGTGPPHKFEIMPLINSPPHKFEIMPLHPCKKYLPETSLFHEAIWKV